MFIQQDEPLPTWPFRFKSHESITRSLSSIL